ITVEANVSAVESTESTIQSVVEETVVMDLPLNGRNPASLVDTTAGVSNPNQNAGQGQLASLNQVVPAGSNPGSITNVNVYPVPSADERAGIFTTVGGQQYQFSSLIPDLNQITTQIPWAAIVGPLIVPSTVNANFYNYLGSGSPLIPL